MIQRYLLTPRQVPAYGQDFLLGEGMESIGITRLLATNGGYVPHTPVLKPALFISHNPDDPNDSSFLASLPADIPIATHVHLQWGYIDKINRRDWARRSISRATVGVVPTEFMRQMFATEFSEVPWKVIKYGLNADRFCPASESERALFRRKHGFHADDVLAIHVGALTAAKGLRILSRFISAMTSNAPRVQLLLEFLANSQNRAFAQYQQEAKSLNAMCPDRIRMLPDKDPLHSDRPVRYCDVLITTSLREVCPLVVLEAFLSGVPVISMDSTPFYRELRDTTISQRFHTVLPLPARFQESDLERSLIDVSERESHDLADRLLSLCKEWESPLTADREQLSKQTRASGFTLPRMLDEFHSIYNEIGST